MKNNLPRYDGPVVVILGPTGSGKTGVSIKIAKAIGGEVISADSRAIYKGMDIGTAKPSIEEQDGVPHFGIDLVEPGERFTVADWKAYAEEKIEEIRARGHVPMVVGGTGLYIDALVYDYQFKAPDLANPAPGSSRPSSRGSDPNSRQQAPKCAGLAKSGSKVITNQAPDRESICTNYLLIGVKTDPEVLRERLAVRAEQMFCTELYDETKKLVEKYGWDSQAMKSNIYQFAWQYLNGEITLEKAKELFIYDDWHLAKRQLTWFKRTPEINWLPLEKIYSFVLEYIQNEQRK